MLYFFWEGPPPGGHAVVAILIDGNYYIVDPQTGEVLGPIEEGTWLSPTDFVPKLKELLDQRYGVPNPGKITVDKHKPDYVDPYDVKPWHEDPDVRDWVERMFPGYDPDEFIWPTN